MIKKLNELKSGESGVLVSYGSGGDLELKRHLLGMGFIKGVDMEIHYPMKRSMIILQNFKIS